MISIEELPDSLRTLAVMRQQAEELEIQVEELGAEIVALNNDIMNALNDSGFNG